MAENFNDIVVKLKNLAKQTQEQSKELKHLKSFGENLAQRMKSILCILEDQDSYEKIKTTANLNKAIWMILHTLENEVKSFLNDLSQDGLEAEAEICVNIKNYTEKYGKISGILDGAIAILNKGLDIKEDITSDRISAESLAVKKELADIKKRLDSILQQSQKRSETIASLERYVCNLDRSISDLQAYSEPSPKEVAQINKKFYYRCAEAPNDLALNMAGDLSLNGDDINELQQSVQSQQAVFIGCAFGQRAIVLPPGNSEIIRGVLSLLSKQKEKDGKEVREMGVGVLPDSKPHMNRAINNKQKSSSNFEKNDWSFNLCCFTLFSCQSNACKGESGDNVELSSPNRYEP